MMNKLTKNQRSEIAKKVIEIRLDAIDSTEDLYEEIVYIWKNGHKGLLETDDDELLGELEAVLQYDEDFVEFLNSIGVEA
jgi:hypothetical protein